MVIFCACVSTEKLHVYVCNVQTSNMYVSKSDVPMLLLSLLSLSLSLT